MQSSLPFVARTVDLVVADYHALACADDAAALCVVHQRGFALQYNPDVRTARMTVGGQHGLWWNLPKHHVVMPVLMQHGAHGFGGVLL